MLMGRAQYNLLQYRKRDNPQLEFLDWQVRDYRALSENELFEGLKALGITADPEMMKGLTGSPEEIAVKLPKGEREQAYLYLFELWRRYCPDQKTVAIFADELDAFIEKYDQGKEILDESLLIELFDILDESVDEGGKPKVVLNQLQHYLAHDLESFFYNYITDQIEKGNEVAASELLENIHDYVEGNLWFDFLRIKLLGGVSVEDATAMMARFLEKLKAKPDLEIYFEVLHYLIDTGHNELFIQLYKVVLKEIKTEDHFVEMLEILFSYYTLNDLEKEENLIRALIQERKKLPMEQKVAPEAKEKLSQML